VLIEAEQLDAYSIAVFCARHGISERFYFKLKAAGRGPAEIQLGNRVLISREAAARWRAEREAESARGSPCTPTRALGRHGRPDATVASRIVGNRPARNSRRTC